MATTSDIVGPWQYRLSDNVADLSSAWDTYCKDDIFFSRRFLSGIDDGSVDTVRQYYLEGHLDGHLALCLVLQVKRFALRSSLRDYKPSDSWAARLSTGIKGGLARLVNFNFMVVGNLLLTGQYGVMCNEHNDESTINQAVEAARRLLQRQGVAIPGALLKDYDGGDLPDYSAYGYTTFSVQPSMYLHIDPAWTSLDDYMAAMKSKYRVRIRKALSLIDTVDKHILTETELVHLQSRINTLYHHVSDGASFNMFILPDDYFIKLKRALGEEAQIIGYFLKGELIGFYSAIDHKDHIDAHFLGYDPDLNQELKLYFNMLIGLTSYAIDRGKSGVMMSRTAMEIKSSVGAVPSEQFLFVKAFNPLINRILGPVLQYFLPEEKWQQRHPFK